VYVFAIVLALHSRQDADRWIGPVRWQGSQPHSCPTPELCLSLPEFRAQLIGETLELRGIECGKILTQAISLNDVGRDLTPKLSCRRTNKIGAAGAATEARLSAAALR